MVALHETLGKVLGAFEYGTGLGGSDDGDVLQQVVVAEVVVDAFHQGVLGADYDHVDFVVQNELGDAVEVIGLEVYILAHFGRAGVARSNKELVYTRTLRNFPRQRVLATSASQK